jgi:uncharacterized protein YdiU (UPF0061 family)
MVKKSSQFKLKHHFYDHFVNSDSEFYSSVMPQKLEQPTWVSCNYSLASALEIDHPVLNSDKTLALISGDIDKDSLKPIALAYSGHQFGVWAGQLGDGRAITLGELAVGKDQQLWDIQLKGAGTTPYSRFGDGRAVLRSSIREYLCSEAMHGLGIATTRALGLVASKTPVHREKIESAAMLCRVAQSHIRFGSFEHFYYANDPQALKMLADYVIARHFPQWIEDSQRYLLLLENSVLKTAKTIAQWQAVGFSHGVMNTDNMSILGDTIDYGPFGFMDSYNPHFICNHSDTEGRYSFKNQPSIGLWNLNALASCFSSLLTNDELIHCLKQYEPEFLKQYHQLMANKIGLESCQTSDPELIVQLLSLLEKDAVDYSIFFRKLCDFSSAEQSIRDLFADPREFDNWTDNYLKRLSEQPLSDAQRQQRMRRVNPQYILRNYMAQVAIEAAEQGDYSQVELLLEVLQNPFVEHPKATQYAGPPPDWAAQISVSCSS